MTTRRFLLAMGIATCLSHSALAGDPIPLPAPRTDGGKPLMRALKERRTTRQFSSRRLSPQVLSDLLWAAFGISRPEDGHRTAPSARNWQEIEVYAATADGLYLYDAAANALKPVLQEDVRAFAGIQPFVKDAPVNLIYVADYAKMSNTPGQEKPALAAADTAFIGENVYLFCASEGLATVFRAAIDVPALEKKMKLSESQHVVFSQTVGYPKEQDEKAGPGE